MYIAGIIIVLLLYVLIYKHGRYLEEKTHTELRFRTEWIMLKIQYLQNPGEFERRYKNELPSFADYFYVHAYYKDNSDENMIDDIAKDRIPDIDADELMRD